MIVHLLALIFGFACLIYSADRFIEAACQIARQKGLSPLVIGITLVSVGTSLPEMLVSAAAALDSKPELGIGNAIGSNIANVGLVLGLTALVCPLNVSSQLLKRELPLLILVTSLTYFLFMDNKLSRLEGLLLIMMMAIVTFFLLRTSLNANTPDPLKDQFTEELSHHSSGSKNPWISLFLGIILMPFSSKISVWGAVGIAHWLGISELAIGLTVVAIGTSLPELVASMVAAYRKEPDVVMGNIIGSNLFNLLGVVGIAGLISPNTLPNEIFSRDYPVMALFTAILFFSAYRFQKTAKITRFEGFLMVVGYITYLAYLFLTSM